MVRSQLDAVRHVRRNESGKATYAADPLGGSATSRSPSPTTAARCDTLPPDAPYVISRPETITATIPKAALASRSRRRRDAAAPPRPSAARRASAARSTPTRCRRPSSTRRSSSGLRPRPPAPHTSAVADLADFDSEATIDLPSTIERAPSHQRTRSHELYDVTCLRRKKAAAQGSTARSTRRTRRTAATPPTSPTSPTPPRRVEPRDVPPPSSFTLLNLTPNATNATLGTNLSNFGHRRRVWTLNGFNAPRRVLRGPAQRHGRQQLGR